MLWWLWIWLRGEGICATLYIFHHYRLFIANNINPLPPSHLRFENEYMRGVNACLAALPEGPEKESWVPDWNALMTVSEQACKPAIATLLR
jgi:hypothetical protein